MTRRDFLKSAAFTALALSIPTGGLKLLEALPRLRQEVVL
ncbi:MAG: twin-arginine translocation signal domain-containing protein [Fervidicoccaceae archaeon]